MAELVIGAIGFLLGGIVMYAWFQVESSPTHACRATVLTAAWGRRGEDMQDVIDAFEWALQHVEDEWLTEICLKCKQPPDNHLETCELGHARAVLAKLKREADGTMPGQQGEEERRRHVAHAHPCECGHMILVHLNWSGYCHAQIDDLGRGAACPCRKYRPEREENDGEITGPVYFLRPHSCLPS
ncbi:hypothetical protein LCGC14_1479560 [marine sediment metagenome]|uniref:Uncharacterized protein n=1 Tax=marine sediment metagenome TaxID=412755 RepID=A0A0F9JVW0_9ZZZZ